MIDYPPKKMGEPPHTEEDVIRWM
ncbi:unnamed protein product [Spirodela intermedia]|uniref:Uncharacterized protein n=1 Tax=Spirodela intermedia TaxID=51605 RepID=A0A7I8KU75_SPIIN|nr:unnamed protein product [Spirodela intermedia]